MAFTSVVLPPPFGPMTPRKSCSPDLQIDVLEGFVPVVCDAYVAQRYQCHCGRIIKSVIESMLAIASSRSGSISVHSAPMSRAMVSTTDTGNWFW